VNSEVGEASAAYRNRDRGQREGAPRSGTGRSSRLRFSLDDVISRVEFKAEGKQNPEYYNMLAGARR
jgi:hypothetical protein